MKALHYGLFCCAVAGASFGATSAGMAQGDSRDKTVSVYIGSGTGGGYDSYGRLVGASIGKFLPGNPTVVIKNLPGGGGLKAVNFIATIAPKDGTAIGITNRNLIVAPMLNMVEKNAVQYDSDKLVWLGNMNTDASFVMVRADSGIKTFDDLRGKEFIVGSSGAADNNGIFPYICNNLLGTNFKVVSGYAQSNHLMLALERGEINGIVGVSWASLNVQRPDWVRNNFVRLVALIGTKRMAQLPDVPLLQELAKSEPDRKALDLIAAFNTLGRPFFAPPDTPAKNVADLRNAFKTMANDPEFLAGAKRQNLEVSFIDGETVQQMVHGMTSVDHETAELARKALDTGGAKGGDEKADKP
jgi:tripartite-type tricarboxylate transporter receptor subunit TctC